MQQKRTFSAAEVPCLRGSVAPLPFRAAEDLWHVYNLVREGDHVTATTFRKVRTLPPPTAPLGEPAPQRERAGARGDRALLCAPALARR